MWGSQQVKDALASVSLPKGVWASVPAVKDVFPNTLEYKLPHLHLGNGTRVSVRAAREGFPKKQSTDKLPCLQPGHFTPKEKGEKTAIFFRGVYKG